ncbi:hypothetical protein DPMN_114843 [Dreissena polymorpha]|uniref:Uncharacterized protein n=1 Tax=Dreissena polymorpha TaxID=45954 RepID=A0A9D4KKZ5_DREPO|nr:hypothetical protein DPMN_114843 [Dreissena polymorpha]
MVKRNFQIELKNRLRLFNDQQEMDISSLNQEILGAGLKYDGRRNNGYPSRHGARLTNGRR